MTHSNLQLSLFKTCTKCGRNLPRSQFYVHSSSPDRLQYACKECSRAAARVYRAYRAANPGPRKTTQQRFWEKVERRGIDDCWFWQASIVGSGYGYFRAEGRMVYAHRYAYELRHGFIPEGLYILHHCDQPGCVNPKHLYAGTLADNTRDMLDRKRGRPGSSPGEKNASAKLTWAQVKEIRKRHRSGESRQDLADEFGVSPLTIWEIATGRTWKQKGE